MKRTTAKNMTKQTDKECDEFRNDEIEIERTIQNEAAQ